MSAQCQFEKLFAEADEQDFQSVAAWALWVRDEGYSRRLHGDVLHHKIVDAIIERGVEEAP